MRAVKVQCTVKKEYAEKNAENIARVMKDLRAINNPGIKYSSFTLPDGKTFMHFAMFENEAANGVLNNLDSFKQFQTELKASGLESPPKPEELSFVGSCYDLFSS
jgi:hypothetical protein